ncbi:flagellar hook protein FlgL [Bacillus coahuilensis p1.1.43]|uniref:Flagellar hook protein FlgL n=1 Tax=Bacillus coahuilensis p1.1.43 TaxID=1150625 RepID=A0A147K4V7_9BACI|nr:flagellar hook-associated protein FlgL [Bacillus coahuilensis]KUP04466.1 flagellar hook protein FlgL [Bacillus coahuilensis p1.1.43]
MRVTQGMLAGNSLSNISNSYNSLGKLQDQLATGKKITKPSDDPVVAMKGMYYRSNLTQIEQYKRNLSEGYLWLESSESAIEQANQGLQRVRELTLQGQNGTLSQEDKKAISVEIDQIIQDLGNTANTKVAGKYLFNGTDVANPPITSTNPMTVAPYGTNNYKIEVSEGVFMDVSVNPNNVFSQKLFDTVTNIKDALDNGTDLNALLQDLDDVMNTMSAERSELGARYNRLDMVSNRLGSQEISATQILSDNENVNMEETISKLIMQEAVHNAALATGARVIQPTLLDFLR